MGRTKVEKSPHFHEIMDMIKEGFGGTYISDFLLSEYDETISHTAINNFIKKVKSKTAQEYYKNNKKSLNESQKERKKKILDKKDKEEEIKESTDDVVKKGVNDLVAMDNIIAEANGLKIDLNNIKPEKHTDYIVTTPLDIINSIIKYKQVAIQAVNAKAKILKDEPEGIKDNKVEIILTTPELDDEDENQDGAE